MAALVLYHAFCADGFGAAWAAWKRLGDGASYVPVQHGVPPPPIPAGSEVYILDFAYSRAETEAIHERASTLRVIDHHRTAEEELRGLDYAIFDNQKSGAVLSWEFFHPGEPVPEILRYVMDRDLWLHQLPRSREVFSGLSSYPMDFEVWSALDVERLAEEGTVSLRYQSELVGLVCASVRMETLAGYRVPVVNAPLLGSEVGEELLKRYPEAPFVAIYFDRGDGKRQWSLRSREDFDVAVVARLFQNGGHRQAAGFESDIGPGFMPKPKKLS
ncbi:MAG TPA: phosphoesterase [Vicinamibacteria bacterium]|nr:phosphoesterase [Vicinamibacteria bacterium]